MEEKHIWILAILLAALVGFSAAYTSYSNVRLRAELYRECLATAINHTTLFRCDAP